jgi:hypothetical protein
MNRPRLTFFRNRTTLYFVLVCVLICTSPPCPVGASIFQVPSGASCSDSIKSCKKPVKFISNISGCYTFACEYGAATQYNIHVSNTSDVRTLLQMARDTGH